VDIDRLISDRARAIDASGIRRVFDLGAKLKDPINLSIGQPDFPVPDAIKRAAIDAIEQNQNGYTVTQGIAPLRERVEKHLEWDLGWKVDEGSGTSSLIVSGTSGALVLAFLALIGPGDEAIIPDPYFVMYPHLATICGGKAVPCETYPDFRMTAERVEPLITERTKLVILNSPSNPAGVVAPQGVCKDLLELCRERNILLISDEIYDEFTYSDSTTASASGDASVARCPSPCREPGSEDDVLLVRGFGKTYGVTGWRLGYIAGPSKLINEIAKLQQYTFVCAPSMAQWGGIAALDADVSGHVEDYKGRRDMVVERLSEVTEVVTPGGAFYAFPKVPEHLGQTGSQFIERCIERGVLVIPGGVFSGRDTHIRLSYATSRANLERGLDVLVELMRG